MTTQNNQTKNTRELIMRVGSFSKPDVYKVLRHVMHNATDAQRIATQLVEWHEACLVKDKQETIQACIDALPEKLPAEAHEKWMGKGHLVSLDKGFNLAIDTAHKALNKLKEDLWAS